MPTPGECTLGFRVVCGQGGEDDAVVIPGTGLHNVKHILWAAAVAIGCSSVLVLVLGACGGWSFADDDSAHHDALADWEQAESMARLFNVEWPNSARNVYFARDSWFHHAYEVRVDMDPSDAITLVESVPDCATAATLPSGFINEDWWQVGGVENWQGCSTDPSSGATNSIIADLSDDDVTTVYLAHFQPDS